MSSELNKIFLQQELGIISEGLERKQTCTFLLCRVKLEDKTDYVKS